MTLQHSSVDSDMYDRCGGKLSPGYQYVRKPGTVDMSTGHHRNQSTPTCEVI